MGQRRGKADDEVVVLAKKMSESMNELLLPFMAQVESLSISDVMDDGKFLMQAVIGPVVDGELH